MILQVFLNKCKSCIGNNAFRAVIDEFYPLALLKNATILSQLDKMENYFFFKKKRVDKPEKDDKKPSIFIYTSKYDVNQAKNEICSKLAETNISSNACIYTLYNNIIETLKLSVFEAFKPELVLDENKEDDIEKNHPLHVEIIFNDSFYAEENLLHRKAFTISFLAKSILVI